VWVNEGQVAHTATATGVFDTGLIQPRASASYTFRQAGEHDYLCTPHPFMKGRIVVQGGGQ
jgi:plastocyanin